MSTTRLEQPVSPEGAGSASRPSEGAWQGYWLLALAGAVAMSVAWSWFGFSFEEEMQEQSKALAAGTTMAGFGALMGGVPLVLAHLVGLVLLTIAARPASEGLWFALLVAALGVAVASIVGIIPAQVLYGGELFNMGVNAPGLGAAG